MRFTGTRCLRALMLGAALALVVPFLGAAPATAAPAITIDGNLADLEAAIAANLGSSKGGNICTDATGEIGSAQCAYYVNGYDNERFLVLVVPNQVNNVYTGDVTVYAGWDQVGQVGDVDGNGNPDTFTPNVTCATSDQTGIGSFESYTVDFDFDCDGAIDARFGVKGNQVINFFTLQPVPGATFAFVGDKLEAMIPNVKANSGSTFDICDMRISGTSNAEFDQLAEDSCPTPFTVAFDPQVSVTKTPETQNACPNSNVSWTIVVTNTGPCQIDANVSDVLDVGMTYVSDDQGSSGNTQTRTWTFTNLAPGDSRTIHLTAKMGETCVAPTIYNNVTVEAPHISACRQSPGTASANATASVNCSTPTCSITGILTICTGATTQLCGPDVAGYSYKWSGGETTRCITVGAGTYTLEVTDGSGCKSTCQATVTENGNPTCSITGTLDICDGATTDLCGPDGAGLTYKWSNGETTRCVTVGTGTYTLEVTDANGCKSTCEATVTSHPCVETCCWLTMGGFLNGGYRSGNKDNTFGGNVGPPPSGSWQHIQRNGKDEVFNFHSHDAHVLACGNDGTAGPCHPAGDANWIEFGGTGAYSLNGGARTGQAVWTARAEDHGEPGRQGNQTGGCGTPDFYRIEVRDAETDEVVFTAEGYLDGGNIQIHDCKHAQETSSNQGRHNGSLKSQGTGTPDGGSAEALELYRPTPNPFTQSTLIAYAVNRSEGSNVEIGVYNVAGRLVRTLVSGFQAAGRYQVAWDGRTDDGSTASHGVYFLRAFVGGQRIDAVSRILYLR